MLAHDEPLSAGQIVKLLGGPTALAKRLPSQRSAIANWSAEGIPAKHWPAIARIAAENDGTRHVTIDALERHTHPIASEAAA